MPACADMTELRGVIPVPAFAGIDSSGNPVVLCTEDNLIIPQKRPKAKKNHSMIGGPGEVLPIEYILFHLDIP